MPQAGEYRIQYVAEDYQFRIYRASTLLSVWPKSAREEAFEAFERLKKGQSKSE